MSHKEQGATKGLLPPYKWRNQVATQSPTNG